MSRIKSIRGSFYVPPPTVSFLSTWSGFKDFFTVIGIGTGAKQPPLILPGSQRLWLAPVPPPSSHVHSLKGMCWLVISETLLILQLQTRIGSPSRNSWRWLLEYRLQTPTLKTQHYRYTRRIPVIFNNTTLFSWCLENPNLKALVFQAHGTPLYLPRLLQGSKALVLWPSNLFQGLYPRQMMATSNTSYNCSIHLLPASLAW